MLGGSTGLATVPVCISVNVECCQVLEDESQCPKEGLSSGGELRKTDSILDWSCAEKRTDEGRTLC